MKIEGKSIQMNLVRAELESFVDEQLRNAYQVADSLRLSRKSLTENLKAAARSVYDFPRIRSMPNGYAIKVWATILFVDLRESTTRAELYGEHLTFQTMHAFLPTMAFIVEQYGGVVVGLRGDGLFAAFGLGEDGTNPIGLDHGKCVKMASKCAKAMIETVDEVIGPRLKDAANDDNNFKVPLIGCGIDSGQIVLTRIGYFSATEITAYGTCVNKSAKLCTSNNAIHIGNATRAMFPKTKGGRLRFHALPEQKAFRIEYPDDHSELI